MAGIRGGSASWKRATASARVTLTDCLVCEPFVRSRIFRSISARKDLTEFFRDDFGGLVDFADGRFSPPGRTLLRLNGGCFATASSTILYRPTSLNLLLDMRLTVGLASGTGTTSVGALGLTFGVTEGLGMTSFGLGGSTLGAMLGFVGGAAFTF